MKARYSGKCSGCGTRISPGDEIQIHLKKWLHMTCKNASIAARVKAAGPPTEIPYEEPGDRPTEYAGTRHWRRRNKKFLIRRDTPERPC